MADQGGTLGFLSAPPARPRLPEETVRRLARRMAETVGFTVLSASNGREALKIFSENLDRIVCVILDLTMPHMDGETTFKELQKIKADVPIVLSSGYDAQEIARRFEGLGLAGFIEKPYTRDAMVAVLKRVLSGPGREA